LVVLKNGLIDLAVVGGKKEVFPKFSLVKVGFKGRQMSDESLEVPTSTDATMIFYYLGLVVRWGPRGC
jgi:hypothetical protein